MPHPNAEQTSSMPLGAEAIPPSDEDPSLARRAVILGGGVLATTLAALSLHGAAPDTAFAAQARLLNPPAPAPKEAGLLKGAPEPASSLRWHVPSLDVGSTIMVHLTRGATIATPENTSAADGTTTPADGTITPSDGTTTATDTGVLPEVSVASSGWDSDGVGKHQLYANIETEGMGGARLTVPVGMPSEQERAAIKGIRPQIKSAIAHNVVMTLLLQQSKDATPRDYPREAAELAAKFPHVKYFVLGNEWNSPDFFKHFKDVKEIMRIQYLANKAIHEVRPGVITRGLGLASGYNPERFIKRAAHIADGEYGGWQNVFDWLDEHFYRSLSEDENMVDYLRQFYQGPAYYGEVGWIVGPPSSHPGAVSPAEQALNEISFMQFLAKDPRNRGVGWYLFRNSGNPEDPYKTANVTYKGLELPSYYMMQTTLTGR